MFLMKNFIDHVKRVAKDDIRLYFMPFVAVWNAIRKEITRPPVR
jgi:hypothetical protein